MTKNQKINAKTNIGDAAKIIPHNSCAKMYIVRSGDGKLTGPLNRSRADSIVNSYNSRLTYLNKSESNVDRDQLANAAKEMRAASTALRLDECRCWMLEGSRGRVYKAHAGYILVIHARSKRHWAALKKRLHFCKIKQDGCTEGVLFCEKPNATIRKILGIRKSPKT